MSGIAPSAWAEEGERAIVTALALLNEDQASPSSGHGEEAPAGWEFKSA